MCDNELINGVNRNGGCMSQVVQSDLIDANAFYDN
jgi:hypothetical protein